jgi:N4-(beta-N-acetylglucosaminyl)-L-asparaginase
MTTRRDFLSLGALTTAGLGLAGHNAHADTPAVLTPDQVRQLKPPPKPVIITRVTGDQAVQEAYQMLLDGQDTLDAVHHICLGREHGISAMCAWWRARFSSTPLT